MAWKDNLLDGRYRNVALEVISCEESGGHDVARHAYPYRPGIEAEDLGLKERTFHFSVAFWGDDYETPLMALTKALSMEGIGELVHPVWGSIWVQPTDWSSVFQAEDPDYVAIKITFVEAAKPTELFIRQTPTLVAEAALIADEPVLEHATNALDSSIDKLKSSLPLDQLNAMSSLMNDTLGGIQGEITGAIRTVQNAIDAPRAWAGEMLDSVYGVVSPLRLNPSNLFGGWRNLLSDAQRIGRMPKQIKTGSLSSNTGASVPVNTASITAHPRDVQTVQRFVQAGSAAALASSAATVLVAEAKAPTLTPPQIEQMVGDVRSEIMNAVEALQNDTEANTVASEEAGERLLQYRPVVEALKTLALAVQDAGRAVLLRRPPLINREVPFPANLRLLAHHWYGDHSRAEELMRLNPQIRNPNDIHTAEVLRAYAK
ncbi:DNA circularization protein [Chitinibacter sp. ZOR0017]|uniref:DNA circularization protein n=1 Tax=Chitinibacter sp. ZOR0017 TaxID=1339254 RepID=UPI0018CF2A73|nr:DNA circularization N-terminal domain-containing protein [Chitinibacter sp. ZOR0017]